MKLGEINKQGENNRSLKWGIVEKWRDLNIKRNKEKEEKKSRKRHVACRKEGGSFLLFKIRLRVIHKKRKREKEERE